MAKPLQRIAFIVEEFALQTPAQQLLDRLLIGYPRNGEFHRLENCHLVVHLANGGANVELERRVKDFGLVREEHLAKTVADANAVVLVWRGEGAIANETLLRSTLEAATPGTVVFVHGALGGSLNGARKLAELASARKISLLAGSPLGVTWRLPEVDLPAGASATEALILVQGASPVAELRALEGLLPVIERRRGGERGIRSVKFLAGRALWPAGEQGEWSWPLLAAAISRSNTPQGDPVKDGRTQDLVGLGLVPKLARAPRGWLLEHNDGLRSALLVLDGVVADFNFAVRTQDGSVISAQIYRPPFPADQQFSRLAEVMEKFFESGKPPWPVERNILTAGLLEVFARNAMHAGRRLATPELAISYSRNEK